MSIASAIENAQQKVAAAYTAIENKGGTLPATQDLSNLSTTISDIPTAGTIDSLTINPSTSQQTITASGGVNGYSPITVNAVTSSIDNNITSSNIKDGVSILGVTGNVVELEGETRTEQLSSTAGGTFTPGTGKNGITSITVTPKNYNRGVSPSTTSAVYAVPAGYSGHGSITVNPVTAAIDANIQAGNIKSGVSILGVAGSLVGLEGEDRIEILSSTGSTTFTPSTGKNGITSIKITTNLYPVTVTPSTSSQTISVPSGYSGNGAVTVNPVTSSIDANITAGNIKNGVSILGVTGTYSGSSTTKYGLTLDNILGDVDANGVYQQPTLDSNEFDLSTVKVFPKLSNFDFAYMRYGAESMRINLANCEYITGQGIFANFARVSIMSSLFNNTYLIYAPKLKYINGGSNFQYTYSQSTSLSAGDYVKFDFSSLEFISSASGFQYCFDGLPIRAVRLPNLLVADGASVFSRAFDNNKYTDPNGEFDNISFPALCYIQNAGNMCSDSNYTSASFGNLSKMRYVNTFNGCFGNCRKITHIYFNNLYTDSFSGGITNPFGTGMFNASTAADVSSCTVHFPSNMSSAIAALDGYPLFGGASGKIVLAFDLTPPTIKTITFSNAPAATALVSSLVIDGIPVGSVSGTFPTTLPVGLHCLAFSKYSTMPDFGEQTWTLKVNGTSIDTKGAPYCKFEVGSTSTKFYGYDGTVKATITNSTTMDISAALYE